VKLYEEEVIMAYNKIVDFRFIIEIDGLSVGGFSEVSGFEQTIETEDYREGGGHFVHKLPKAIVQSTLTLKSGMSEDDTLWQWFSDCKDAVLYKKPIKKKNISVFIYDEQGYEQTRFNFENAYPVKWGGPTFNATSNAVSIEHLEIVHEGMERGK